MAYPVTFGTQTSPEPMSNLDLMFNQVGAMIQIPCSASGTNAISLTPLVNCPALSAYNELGGYRFRAVGTSSSAVTAQYNGLGFLPVYHADGVTQANVADIVSGQQYVLMFSQALNSGGGGFFFESPSQPVVTQPWFTPGGRLCPNLGIPVQFSTIANPTTINYSPYMHPFVPIYNGANVQMYNFTSSLSDQNGLQINMGGNAVWPQNNSFDVFAILSGNVPILATAQWTNPTTRALTLSVFGGFLTNTGSATLRISQSNTVLVPANQATFLGSFYTGAGNGSYWWIFGGASSGGTQAFLALCNYYNKVQFNTIVTDSGAQYTYTSATIRQARASVSNAIFFMQSDSERACAFTYMSGTQPVAAGGSCLTGIGVNVTNSFNSYSSNRMSGATAQVMRFGSFVPISITGATTVAANEQGDGTNANVFNNFADNQLMGQLWL